MLAGVGDCCTTWSITHKLSPVQMTVSTNSYCLRTDVDRLRNTNYMSFLLLYLHFYVINDNGN